MGTYGSPASEAAYDVGTGGGADSVYSTIDHKGGAGIGKRIAEAGRQQDSYMQVRLGLGRGGKLGLGCGRCPSWAPETAATSCLRQQAPPHTPRRTGQLDTAQGRARASAGAAARQRVVPPG